MKTMTLTLLAGLTLAVLPSSTLAAEVPGTEYRQATIIQVDTASSEENLELEARPLPDEQPTLDRINGRPGEIKNRDLTPSMRRTYNQSKTIESDYGQEIQIEILEDNEKHNDAEDGDFDDY